ncbi:CHAD domain-containing protein [Lacibacter sp. H407]|uniref:CHAD domain-containing protein n=1 Tax=Lacibacter sp. H407 TaxID=3133423 RepID=UPI0030C630D0
MVREYSEKQISSALHLLEQYNTASNEEVLHQLRVSLKKIKAVLDHLRTLHPKKIKSTRKKLQLVFHAAGSLREAQLRLKWLAEKKLLLLIRHSSFDQKIKEEEELFVTNKHGHLKKLKSVSEEIDKYLKKVEEEDLLRYALELKAKLQEQLPIVLKDNWHALRKLIKQLLYAYHWLTEQDKLKVLTVTAYKRLDMLQENIGIWHDVVDLQQWLTDGQFFLSKEKSVKQQFNKAFALVQKDIEVKEKVVMKQLQAIKKPANQK